MENLEILIGDLRSNDFIIQKGSAKALLKEELSAGEYTWLKTGSREYDTALRERITEPFNHGMLVVRDKQNPEVIKFEDRKVRYAGHTIGDGKAVISVAPTHFSEFRRTNVRAGTDEAFREYLSREGIAHFRNRWAYFADCFGVSALPITSEGAVHLLKRSQTAELFPGHWHTLGGLLDSELSFFEREDPSAQFRALITDSIRGEFCQEASAYNVSFSLRALVRNGTLSGALNPDFIHFSAINASAEEFKNRRTKAQDAADHTEVVSLHSLQEVHNFMTNEKKITPVAYASLDFYLDDMLHQQMPQENRNPATI